MTGITLGCDWLAKPGFGCWILRLSEDFVIPAGFSREESVVSRVAESRFLGDESPRNDNWKFI